MPLLTRTADRLQRGLAGEPVGPGELTELVRLVHALPPATRLVAGPSADFVARLGVRLREEAGRRPAPVVTPIRDSDRDTAATAPPRRTPTVVHLGGRGLRLGLAAVAVVAVLLGGVGIASRSAVPGSLLYPVKELLDKVAVGLAGSPHDTGMTYLAQAQEHVSDARRLTASRAPAAPVEVALSSAADAVRDAQREFAGDDDTTGPDRDARAMRDFAAQVLPQLDALRPSLQPVAQPTLERLVALLEPYAAGSGPAGTVPGQVGPGTTLPGLGSPGPSGVPATSEPGRSGATVPSGVATGDGGASGLPSLPVKPPSHGVGVTLPGSSVTVGPTGGGVVIRPTVGPISPTVSVSVPRLTSILPTLPPVVPAAPFKVGDTVTVLGSPVAGLVGRSGKVVAVDTTHKTATVQLRTLLGVTTRVTLPYGSLAKA